MSISSISIDNNKESWKVALAQEKMTWKQFIAIDSSKNLLDLHFNIKSIPKVYLFDKNKNLIEKFDDSNSG